MGALTIVMIGEALTVVGAGVTAVGKVIEVKEQSKKMPEAVVNFIGNEAINDYKNKESK